MTTIRRNLKINVSDNKDLIEKTIIYFQQSGFKITEQNMVGLKIKRGSIFSNMWTFNPLKWKSEIDIEIKENEINADIHIDATGQMPTIKEEKLWDTFINNYKLFVTETNFDFQIENQKALNSTKKNSVKYVGWATLGGLIGGIPAGLIGYWTGIDILVSIGAAGGAIGLLTMKINEKKKENAL